MNRTPEQVAADVAEDLDHLRDQDHWPNWPILPVKRRNGFDFADRASFGVVVADRLTVFLVGMYEIPAGNLFETLRNVEKIDYPSLEALAAEWRVD